MKYCSECGASVAQKIPDGDDRPRHVCEACDTIHYQNPRIIAGCIPVYEGRVLLCRRAIEPRKGYWTLPAGFMENAETVEEAAARETWEEACAKVDLDGIFSVFSVKHINQVHMFFRATMPNAEFAPGAESLETELFAEEDIPWEELAFPTVIKTLRYYFSDRASGEFPVRVRDIEYRRPSPPSS